MGGMVFVMIIDMKKRMWHTGKCNSLYSTNRQDSCDQLI